MTASMCHHQHPPSRLRQPRVGRSSNAEQVGSHTEGRGDEAIRVSQPTTILTTRLLASMRHISSPTDPEPSSLREKDAVMNGACVEKLKMFLDDTCDPVVIEKTTGTGRRHHPEPLSEAHLSIPYRTLGPNVSCHETCGARRGRSSVASARGTWTVPLVCAVSWICGRVENKPNVCVPTRQKTWK